MPEINNPFVVVLILSYNGKSLLDDSLSSYLENDYANYKIVVIDNGSVDGTKEYVETKYPAVTVYRTDVNRAYAGGFNFGLEYAFKELKADYVIVSNNDVRVDKSLISEMLNVAQSDPKNGFVTGKVYFFDKPTVFQTVGKNEDPIKWNGSHIGWGEEDKGQHDEIRERIFSDDIVMMVSSAVYKDTDGYNTLFRFQCEECDWEARAKIHGYRIMYAPKAKVWHKVSMTIGKASAFKAYYDFKNMIFFILLNREPDYFRRFIWSHFRVLLWETFVNFKRLRWFTAVRIWMGFMSAMYWSFTNNKLTLRHIIKT